MTIEEIGADLTGRKQHMQEMKDLEEKLASQRSSEARSNASTASSFRSGAGEGEERTLYPFNDYTSTKFMIKTEPYSSFETIRNLLR